MLPWLLVVAQVSQNWMTPAAAWSPGSNLAPCGGSDSGQFQPPKVKDVTDLQTDSGYGRTTDIEKTLSHSLGPGINTAPGISFGHHDLHGPTRNVTLGYQDALKYQPDPRYLDALTALGVTRHCKDPRCDGATDADMTLSSSLGPGNTMATGGDPEVRSSCGPWWQHGP